MGTFFEDTMKALLEAIAIDSADLKEVKNMPAPTTEKESELIDRAIEIRKQEKISQQKLAELTGNNQRRVNSIVRL